MSFQISPSADKNKVFLLKYNEVEGRLDPFYYTPQFEEIINLDKFTKYPLIKISHLSHFVTDGIHKTPIYSDNGLPFLQANNIKEGEINFKDNIKRVNDEWRDEALKRYTPKAGDVLVTKDGTIGVAATVPDSYEMFSTFVSVLTIRPKLELIIPEYLRILISSRLVQKQILRSTRGAVLSHLLLEETRELKIPTPKIDIQRKIVSKMSTAFAAKKQKEIEAQRLLDGIDDYLLSELGIKTHEPEENTIQNCVFYRKWSEVSGSRLDPLYHSESIYRFIEKTIYNFEYLSKITHYMKSGFAAGRQNQSNNDKDIIQIRPTNISDERDFIFTKNVYIDSNELVNKQNDILQYNEILFNNTNSQELVGKSILFDLDSCYFCSNHITRISVNIDKIIPRYLTYILNLYQRKKVFFKICTNWNNQSGVNADVLGQIKVPVPPREKQAEIANHMTFIRNEAKKLQYEAKEEFEQAKKEVEVMILGDDL